MKKVIGIVIAVALVAVIVIQQRKIGALQAQGFHRTAQYARTILVRALNQAVKWRLLSYNPAALTEPPHVEKHVIEPLSVQ